MMHHKENESHLKGVDLVVSLSGDLGKPTGETGWCYECECMMINVYWNHEDKNEWVCFSALLDIGEKVWKINPNLFG